MNDQVKIPKIVKGDNIIISNIQEGKTEFDIAQEIEYFKGKVLAVGVDVKDKSVVGQEWFYHPQFVTTIDENNWNVVPEDNLITPVI